jgi:vesicle coat complex subunit
MDDPSYVKLLKVKILAQLATSESAQQIVDELCGYVNFSSQIELVQATIRALGKIAIRLQDCLLYCMEKLIGFLDYEDEEVVVASTIIAIRGNLICN